jgi:hypothetical protein
MLLLFLLHLLFLLFLLFLLILLFHLLLVFLLNSSAPALPALSSPLAIPAAPAVS